MKCRAAFLPAAIAGVVLFGFGCKSEDTSVIDDPAFVKQIPHINTLTVSADTLDTWRLGPATQLPTDTVQFSWTVRVGLAPGTPPASIAYVQCTIYDPDDRVLARETLRNDGVAPDAAAGDSVFTSRVPTRVVRYLVGDYRFAVTAVNRDSNTDARSAAVRVINSGNRKPALANLDAPDTVTVPASGAVLYLISVHAADPETLGDVMKVAADVFDANNRPTQPFDLFDDGELVLHGDTTRADGRYSRLISIDSSNTRNTHYTFKLYAVDRSGAVSDSLSTVIYTR